MTRPATIQSLRAAADRAAPSMAAQFREIADRLAARERVEFATAHATGPLAELLRGVLFERDPGEEG